VELCVSASNLHRAAEILARPVNGLERIEPSEPDVFTEYKSTCARYKNPISSGLNIVLVPDTIYGFERDQAKLRDPLPEPTYSKEILSVRSPTEVANLPFPTLPEFFGVTTMAMVNVVGCQRGHLAESRITSTENKFKFAPVFQSIASQDPIVKLRFADNI
jgi:hypothetical protein